MLRATFVVFLLLFAQGLLATELERSIAGLETAWAEVYYQKDEARQKQTYPVLLQRTAELVKRYPNAAEPKVWLATIMATNAAFESSFDALASLVKAKALLEEAIKINPQALDGAAYVTLGTLYYMLPGWPISFGDDEIAEQLLKTSLSINPQGIDANYFYADFLLSKDRTAEAIEFFQRASQAPLRQQQIFADTELQNEARLGLVNAQHRKSGTDKNRFHSLFVAATVKSE